MEINIKMSNNVCLCLIILLLLSLILLSVQFLCYCCSASFTDSSKLFNSNLNFVSHGCCSTARDNVEVCGHL